MQRLHRAVSHFLLARCDFHERGANKFVAEAVAGNYLLHHCVGLVFVGGFSDDSLMNVGIELFTNSGNRLHAQRIQHAIELFGDKIHAAEKMAKLVRL